MSEMFLETQCSINIKCEFTRNNSDSISDNMKRTPCRLTSFMLVLPFSTSAWFA